MSANNIGHLQLPMAHQATDNETVMKHCRIVEDKVVFHQLDMNAMTLLFKKDESARSNDKRKTTQLCKTLSSKHFKSSDGVWATSKACESGYIGKPAAGAGCGHAWLRRDKQTQPRSTC